jgi:hypothetical protein
LAVSCAAAPASAIRPPCLPISWRTIRTCGYGASSRLYKTTRASGTATRHILAPYHIHQDRLK